MWQEQKRGTRGESRVCHWCSYHILTSSVIYSLNRRTATWNLFVLYNKETNYYWQLFNFKIFLNYSKADLCPVRRTRKKPFGVICCLYKMKQSHWLLCVAKNCDWSRKITPLSNLTPENENLQRRQNWTAKSTNLKEYTGKIKSVFVIRTALWAEKVGCCLEYCRTWKNTLGKLAVDVNTGGHLIRVLNVRSVTDGGNLCPLWLVILNQFDIVSETPYSCNTVRCSEQCFARCCALKQTGPFSSESKATCLF